MPPDSGAIPRFGREAVAHDGAFSAAFHVVAGALPALSARTDGRVISVMVLADVDRDLGVEWEWTSWTPEPAALGAPLTRLPLRARMRLRRAARRWGDLPLVDLVELVWSVRGATAAA